VAALDRLRLLDFAPGEQSAESLHQIMVPLNATALTVIEAFAQKMQWQQQDAGGLLRSAYGKARGLAVRFSLVLEMLHWCGNEPMDAPPVEISKTTVISACNLVANYFLPMAARVFGDATAPQAERNAATLARWIVRQQATEIHVRRLQREVRLPGLQTARLIHEAASVLVEADWLAPLAGSGDVGRPRAIYLVNPAIRGSSSHDQDRVASINRHR
jgi:hypothetical protein